MWQADYVASDVLDIDYKYLFDSGIRAIAYDVDDTLTQSGAIAIDAKRAKKLVKMLDNAGITKRMLASNAERDLSGLVGPLKGFEIIQPHNHKPKPFKDFYRQVIEKADLPAEQIVMVGDRLVQDVIGAKRLGLKSIIVAIDPGQTKQAEKYIFRHLWQPKSVARKTKK